MLEYIIDLTADVTERKMEFRNEVPCEALRQAFNECESCVIQSLDLNFLDLTVEVMDVFAKHLSVIPVHYVRLYDVWNGDGGTMDDLLTFMRGLSEADPAEQATDDTLRICREIGVSRVYVCAADLISESSAISEEGIFDFCFGAEVDPSPGIVRELDVYRPHLTPQFVDRLILTNMKARSKTPLILKINTPLVFETNAFPTAPCDHHPGLCYRFEGDVSFQLRWNAVGKLDLRRGAEVNDHTTLPQEDESGSYEN